MSLLWLSKETPDRFGQGGQRRQYFQIKTLVEHGIVIRVLSMASSQNDASVRELARVTRLPSGRGWGRVRTILLDRALRGHDRLLIAHAESFDLVRSLTELPSDWCLDFHNVNSRWYRRLGNEQLERRWERVERQILRSAALATCCSEQERDVLTRLGGRASVRVAANGVDPEEWPIVDRGRHEGHGVVAFGTWPYPPNRDGLDWFVTNVWPRVRAVVPDATLDLAGPGPVEGAATHADGVRHHGYVDDLSAFVSQRDVVVVPAIGGPGTPLKFAESLTSGLPVVATPDAAQGNRDAPIDISDDPAAFAGAVVKMLLDPSSAREAGGRARSYALSRCSWATTQHALVEWAGTK